MLKFLIDVNLPSKSKVWRNESFVHQTEINDDATDDEIWEYAKHKNLTIISKDADFSLKIMLSEPPPKIIHFKIGNMRFKDFYDFIELKWNKISAISENHKLTNVFIDRIEGIN